MKRSLQVKVWILLGYVLVCTAAVLDQQSDPPEPNSADSMAVESVEAP